MSRFNDAIKSDPVRAISELSDKSSGCWILPNSRAGKYRLISFGGGNIAAHRLSYSLFKGDLISGLVVMHSCDNPPCVNPDHLSQGTYRENTLDAYKKGRLDPAKVIQELQKQFLTSVLEERTNK